MESDGFASGPGEMQIAEEREKLVAVLTAYRNMPIDEIRMRLGDEDRLAILNATMLAGYMQAVSEHDQLLLTLVNTIAMNRVMLATLDCAERISKDIGIM